jgi:hypothetical protein
MTIDNPAAPAANPRFLTIIQAAKVRPAFSPASLRDIKFKSQDRANSRGEHIAGNGAAAYGVFIQVGRKVLVDIDAFDAWVLSHREAA